MLSSNMPSRHWVEVEGQLYAYSTLELEGQFCSEPLPATLPPEEWPVNQFKCGRILCKNCLLKHGIQGKIEEGRNEGNTGKKK